MKTGSPTVVAQFPCAVCGARLDRLHLDPGPEGSFICSFCGAPEPEHNGHVSGNGDHNGRAHITLVEASDVLREARERRGESLEDVADDTGINLRYLEDLEGGDASFEPYPGRVYGRFFLREYAEHLGLDPEPMVEAFDGESGPVRAFEPTAGVVRTSGPPRRSVVPRLVAITVVALLLIGGAVLRARDVEPSFPDLPVPAGTSTRSQGEAAAAEQPPAHTKTVRGIRAVVHVSNRCWIEAISDGTTTLRKTVEAGTVLRLRADRRLELTLGNSDGAHLVVNGRRVATSSPTQVARLSFVLRRNEIETTRA
jgi:cytoskeleton protein RodZ